MKPVLVESEVRMISVFNVGFKGLKAYMKVYINRPLCHDCICYLHGVNLQLHD